MNSKIELFITVISSIVVIYTLIAYFYLNIPKRFVKRKLYSPFFNLWVHFRDTKINKKYLFLSIIWLIVYYFSFIKTVFIEIFS